AVVVVDDNDWVRPDLHGHEVPGLGYLTDGGHEDPVGGEHRRDIQVEDVLTQIERCGQRVAGCSLRDECLDVVMCGTGADGCGLLRSLLMTGPVGRRALDAASWRIAAEPIRPARRQPPEAEWPQ